MPPDGAQPHGAMIGEGDQLLGIKSHFARLRLRLAQ
jgi:hypothetical protein